MGVWVRVGVALVTHREDRGALLLALTEAAVAHLVRVRVRVSRVRVRVRVRVSGSSAPAPRRSPCPAG